MSVYPPRRKATTPRVNRFIPMREVESQPCPDRPGLHWLINHGADTVCRGCGRSWADLDAELREAS